MHARFLDLNLEYLIGIFRSTTQAMLSKHHSPFLQLLSTSGKKPLPHIYSYLVNFKKRQSDVISVVGGFPLYNKH